MRSAPLQRAIILPRDLYAAVERVARADGFLSVQAWAVCRFQVIVNERPETESVNTRA